MTAKIGTLCNTTVNLRQLTTVGIVKKLETWVPHALTEKQHLRPLETCKSPQEREADGQQNIQKLEKEFLPNPLYSPELSLTDYIMFHLLGRWLRGKQFPNLDALIQGVRKVFDQYNANFCHHGITSQTRWVKCI
ncbi:hypothetical protein TNCT_659421 [Trichonephila clavata]|uniref:Uncharacterized protein n=1 Tax=Trichonephila clavata TaxID=2740835 RepID=A0A8X6LDN9_TRICU|nr:hypothetical protein TNCT_659421 [Trichonephila clavata]